MTIKNNEFKKGSEWRKWDLHFHTPSSYDYKDHSITNQDIITGLIENNISVVAITDHHIIDVLRIKELQSLANSKNITILPGIEFLSNAKGSDPVHFIAIFPEDTSKLDYIWGQIKNRTAISQIEGSGKKINEVYCDLNETILIIKELGGIVSIHAGNKSNSIECITNSLKHTMAQKTDIAHAVDIYELGKNTDQEGYVKSVFPAINKRIPMVICSDNHNIKKYDFKDNCWIKADPTFEGLKQIIYEPEERVRIQNDNPEFEFNKPFFSLINNEEKVAILNDNKDLCFESFKIPLNKNLVAIIGGRGTGKSRLVDYLAWIFSKNDKEINYIPSNKITVEYTKNNILTPETELYKADEENFLDFIYIQQSKLKEISDRDKIAGQIKKLLGIDGEEFNQVVNNEAGAVLNQIETIKKWFDFRDEDGDPINNRKWVEKFGKEQEALLKSVETNENKEKLKRYIKNIEELKKIETTENDLKGIHGMLGDIGMVNSKIGQINISFSKITGDYKVIEIINTKKQIDDIRLNIETLELEKAGILSANKDIKVEFEKEGYKGDLENLLSNVDTYKTNIEFCQQKIKEIETKELEYRNYIEHRASLASKIKTEYQRQINTINMGWSSVLSKHGINKNLIEKILLEDGAITVNAEIIFDQNIFYKKLEETLDGRSYTIKKIKEKFEISNLNEWVKFVEKDLPDFIEGDESQYVRGNIQDVFFNLYTRSQYMRVMPQIKYQGKTLDKVSVGQRGTAYLCLQLATYAFSKPILFDQPEDDLDNEFIMNRLIHVFRELKKYRQIIIVTHNANLVVNADAEQVIVAENINEKLNYFSGSLENPQIIESVCKILEGGKIAFEQRKKKYNI